MKHYLYHVTKKENVPAIIREGIKRKYGFAVSWEVIDEKKGR